MLSKAISMQSLWAKGSISKVRLFVNVTQKPGLGGKLLKNRFSTSTQLPARGARVRSKATTSIPGKLTAISVGQASLAGASLLGIGGLCFYGLGFSSEVGAIDKAAVWPQYVRQRIRDTYLYFGGSLLATAGSALAIARNPTLMSIVSRNGIVSMVVTIGAMIGTSMLCRSIEYKPGFGPKQMAWLLHTAVIGAVIAPLTVLGGPLMIRAAWYTAGVVAGLSTVAVCAPSDKFLNMGGPLAAGLGVVFVSSIGSAFFPPTGALGLSLYSIAIYGGLILFGGFLLYDTQRIIKHAESMPHPAYTMRPFDPVNASMSIYMDAVNIFIRILMIMANGNRRK
uniref:Growth hormone-inducible transmembrane protein-like n=1 Tax=Phallusia mammillata TaxID=59560 RepID=A0A6F9DE39_9ASCI|nr:growth hormone-inducible transmembrane protein-like [Phallusia mammillata]